MRIEIISAYDEVAWYSRFIGNVYEVLETSENGDVKVKRGNGKYSYWVGKNDYKIACNCSEIYNCCDCGCSDDNGCGCAYCWSCNACEDCLSEE